MENVKQTYDMFVQNQLPATSHTLEWLPIGHQDPDNKKFDLQYFILGTHIERVDDESATPDDKLKLVRVRVPNCPFTEKEMLSYSSGQNNLSRLEIVREFSHEQEVIKARCIPGGEVVASMTNSGVINLYNIPEIG
jgi:hypothetical protein